MRAFKPKGVTIYRSKADDNGLRLRDPEFTCTIKGRGRTGASTRSRLMRLSAGQRDPILREWARGRAVEL
jgi:hypothetical protein